MERKGIPWQTHQGLRVCVDFVQTIDWKGGLQPVHFRAAMSELTTDQTLTPFEVHNEPVASDASAYPFKLVVDPVMRMRLRKALFDLIENHDNQLADCVANGELALDSYKEYIEIFARSLRESMTTVEGVQFLLASCGFHLEADDINLYPETRWKKAAAN